MKFNYLIDYENVRDDGLDGIFELGNDDVVNIFFTENADRMGFSLVSKLLAGDCRAKINFLNVAPGKQSLDMQLSSYLGYLLGKDGSDGTVYIIISEDKGYESVLKFWNNGDEKRARLFPKIKTCVTYFKNAPLKAAQPAPADENPAVTAEPEAAETAPAPKKKPAAKKKAAPKKKAEDAVKTEVKQKGQKETELNNSVQQTLSKVKIDGNAIDGNVINKVASIVKSHRQDASNKILTNIRNALVKEYKQEKGNELYKAIKKHIEEYKKEQ